MLEALDTEKLEVDSSMLQQSQLGKAGNMLSVPMLKLRSDSIAYRNDHNLVLCWNT